MLNEIWAKKSVHSTQSVITHGLCAGYCAQYLLAHYISSDVRNLLSSKLCLKDYADGCLATDPENMMVCFIGYYVSLHDIGKIDASFQNEENRFRIEKVRHEKTSYDALMRIWESGQYRLEKRICRVLSEIIRSHHQGKMGKSAFVTDEYKAMQVLFENHMQKHFMMENHFFFPSKKPDTVSQALLLGILVFSDWVVSGQLFENVQESDNLRFETEKKVFQLLEENDLRNDQTDFGTSFQECWPEFLQPRDLQLQTEKIFDSIQRPQLILMEAPMGEGKTEASIYAAVRLMKLWNKNGFYIGLPTSATANQMVRRVRAFIDSHDFRHQVKLLHSQAWLQNDFDNQFTSGEEDQYIMDWLKPSRRSLLANYAVGTVDQAMFAAMNIRYGVLRLLGIAEKVLIIDEIHAYDLYMLNIMKNLLIWCRELHVPVILLSATLPVEKKRELIGIFTDQKSKELTYPVITTVYENGSINERMIAHVNSEKVVCARCLYCGENAEEQITEKALDLVNGGGCLCVVVNTIRMAQNIYQLLQKESTGEDLDLMLFHARFTSEIRNRIENDVLRKFGKNAECRPKRAVLIATQVVEQSLDVDFDFMISAIAPMDLLLQRMGRVGRHKKTPRPAGWNRPVFITAIPMEDGHVLDSVYHLPVIKQTMHLLVKHGDTISIPNDLQTLVNNAYDIRCVPEAERKDWLLYEEEEKEKSKKAEKYKLSLPPKKLNPLIQDGDYADEDQNSGMVAKTRDGEDTVMVIFAEETVYSSLSEQEGMMKSGIAAKELMKHGVRIPARKFFRYKDQISYINGKGYLNGALIVPEQNDVMLMDDCLGLIWREERR